MVGPGGVPGMTRVGRPHEANGTDGTAVDHAVHQRVALVGCGQRFATSVAPTLWHTNATVVLAVDPDSRARSRAAARAPHGPNLILAEHLTERLLRETAADAIIISSPSGLHFEHCEIALSCGLPTFVEKPLACTVRHARTLQAAADGRLAASEQRIHRNDLAYVRKSIQDGWLGEISEIFYHDSIAPAPQFASSWRNDPRLAGGGILLDLGYHTTGSIQWLLDLHGQDFEITSARLSSDRLKVENAAQVACTAAGIEINLDIRLAELAPAEMLVIRGTRGELQLARERKKPSQSTISAQVYGQEATQLRLSLDESSDSRSLHNFLCGRAQANDLRRHIDTLEFLQLIYDRAGGRTEWSVSGCA